MSDTYPTRTVTAPSYRPADAPKVVYVWCAKPSDDIELSVVPTYTPIDTNVISIAVTGSTGRDNGNTLMVQNREMHNDANNGDGSEK